MRIGHFPSRERPEKCLIRISHLNEMRKCPIRISIFLKTINFYYFKFSIFIDRGISYVLGVNFKRPIPE